MLKNCGTDKLNNLSFVNGSSNVAGVGLTKEEKAILIATYYIVLIVALIGNVLIILVFSKYKPLRTSINYFVVNMAVSDLFTPLTIMPFTIAQTLSSGPFPSRLQPEFANIICKLCYFLADVSVLVSIQSLMLISVDRLIAVVFPLKIKLISRKVRLVCILVSWIVAIAAHGHYLHILRVSSYGYCCFKANWTTETNNTYKTAMFIVFYLVPVCLLTIIYSTIAWTLKRRQNERRNMSECKRSRGPANNRQVVRLSIAILAAFTVCIGPLFVCAFIIIFKFHGELPSAIGDKIPQVIVFIIRKLLLHSWGALNPCICFAFSENYRTGFKHLVFGRRRVGRTAFPQLVSIMNMTFFRRRTKRSSSFDHVSMKSIIEAQQETEV
ncbi:neuropeptide FF receptor 1-like [Montipora foliosa]|uniref:neuropeptide FF receptor 1-like n=1 Tax=Montipora foliosa TaxID=591990 RepID=UPI0035F139FF